jgi:hypothetical protein
VPSLWRFPRLDVKGGLVDLIKRHHWGMHAAMPISVRFHRQRICWLPVASRCAALICSGLSLALPEPRIGGPVPLLGCPLVAQARQASAGKMCCGCPHMG